MSGNSGAPDAKASASHAQRPRNWKLPPWLDHFNSNDLKILARCWVATWVAMLLTFIHPALVNLGQATFFCALVLFIVPPASIVFVYLLAGLSLLLGMCMAWAWGLLTMKAALAARPEAETRAKVQALQQQAASIAQRTGQNVAWEAQILVNDGFMLDTRVTVIFYVMGCIFIYALSRLRCSNPKFMLTHLFGSIVTDLFILFGPTLPRFTATLPEVLIKPGAIGIGLGMACCLLFFPTSTSATVLNGMGKLISSTEMSLNAIRGRLNDEQIPAPNLLQSKARILGIYKTMLPAIGFLPLDISRGLWSADDLNYLQGPLREVMMASLALIDVHASWIEGLQKKELLKSQGQSDSDGSTSLEKQQQHGPGHRELLENAHLMEALGNPDEDTMNHDAIVELRRTTDEILSVCSRAIKQTTHTIQTVNGLRWLKSPTPQLLDQLRTELQKTLTDLRVARATCVTETTNGVLKAYSQIFDENDNLKANWSLAPGRLRGIILAMVIEERILVVAEAIEKLVQSILQLLQTRQRRRFWLPSQLQYAKAWLFHAKNAVPDPQAFADEMDEPEDPKISASYSEDSKETLRRSYMKKLRVNPNRRQNKLSRAIVQTYRWLSNASGLFALRMVAVTIITSIPASVSNSAGFFYREKGIWAVITAQTCMMVYTADFTSSLVFRAAGTVFGGLLGMIAWYVGSGNGRGNPYGMAATTAVMIFILLWLRIFLPPANAKATILAGATFLLVVGFSYDQGHILQYGLPGVGYEAFWKRLVTVLIGFVVATLVQIIPKPPSATRHVRKTLSKSVGKLSSHYALLLSHWGHKDADPMLGVVVEDLSIEVAETLTSLNEMINVLQFEMTTGPFDQKILRQTQMYCQGMNQSLRRLLDLSTSLPDYLQQRLARSFGLLDDRMIGDVMAVLKILQDSLITATPLPERLPTPLIRRFYDSWDAQHRKATLSKELVRDENYRRYCVAMSSYLKFLSLVDDLVVLLKTALGETHVIGHFEDV